MNKSIRYATYSALLGLGLTAWSQVPGILSYQGRLTVSGTNYTGAAQLKVALIDGAFATSYWSNDGTSVNGGEPTAPTLIKAQDGVFRFS